MTAASRRSMGGDYSGYNPPGMAPRVYLVDGSAQFHRAYHAIRGLATSRGLPTNATYGFTTMLKKLVEDEKPE